MCTSPGAEVTHSRDIQRMSRVQTTMSAHSATKQLWGDVGRTWVCCPDATASNGQVLVLDAVLPMCEGPLLPKTSYNSCAPSEQFRTASQFLSMNVLATSGSVCLSRHILHATSSPFHRSEEWFPTVQVCSGHKLVLGWEENEAPALLASPMRSQYLTVSNDIPICVFSPNCLIDPSGFWASLDTVARTAAWLPAWARVCPTKWLKYLPNPQLRMQWTIQPCPVSKKNCHDPKDAHKSNKSSLSIKTFHNDVPHFTTVSVTQCRT